MIDQVWTPTEQLGPLMDYEEQVIEINFTKGSKTVKKIGLVEKIDASGTGKVEGFFLVKGSSSKSPTILSRTKSIYTLEEGMECKVVRALEQNEYSWEE